MQVSEHIHVDEDLGAPCVEPNVGPTSETSMTNGGNSQTKYIYINKDAPSTPPKCRSYT